MTHSYYELYLHLVWSTKYRYSMIKENFEKEIYKIILDKCIKYNIELITIGNTQDHVHILISFNPTVKISDIISEFKGTTAYFINHNFKENLYWQNGYGALSVSKSGIAFVKKYIQNQKEIHAKRNLIIPLLEKAGVD